MFLKFWIRLCKDYRPETYWKFRLGTYWNLFVCVRRLIHVCVRRLIHVNQYLLTSQWVAQLQKQSSRGVLWKKCSYRFSKIHRKTPVPKETLAQVFSCEFWEISKNNFFYRTILVAASATWIRTGENEQIKHTFFKNLSRNINH